MTSRIAGGGPRGWPVRFREYGMGKAGCGAGPAPPMREPRSRAEIAVHLDGDHKIAWYHYGVFEMTCGNMRCHGNRCRKNRTSKAPRVRRAVTHPKKGRPLGFLLAWASRGSELALFAEHMSFEPTFDQRCAARAAFAARVDETSRLLLAAERPQGPDEGPEPLRCL